MSDLSVDDNILTVGSTEIAFDYEIGDVIEFDSVIVVRLVIPPEETHNRNVVGIDKTGTKRWTIPESLHSSAEDNPYLSLRVRDGELWTGNWRGWTYRVDLETGALREYEFTK
ncbi:hypothetical protein [Haloterrigena salifodinae]|uniref:Uncharacterized protein n=1 Tax=Haloterrigena salifodinae TaxID=2675099 RepID=A0A8T8E535_9EURY|nr:hypothetical protein [Haloterrigena salifodinae]QRV16542.1 hypothetical protein JMJ58_06550 [Haloterrigena salifodinae]